MGYRSPYVSPRVLAEYRRVLSRENALALEVCEATGMRIGDVLKIEKCALIPPDTIVYIAQKTGKKGKKVISEDLFDRLTKTGNRRWCFPSPRNGVKKRTRQGIYKAMRRASKANNLPRASPHSARKAYAVELAKRAGLDAVARELQHTHYDTTMIYALADVLDERLREKEKNDNAENE